VRGRDSMRLAPRYYWFGTPGADLRDRVLRRRGDI
jgi:hypothetical protein